MRILQNRARGGSYQLIYNYGYNGGTSFISDEVEASSEISNGDSVSFEPQAEKANYEFVGWNTDPNATVGLDSLSVNNRDITLYAIYKKTINVTYNYYNGLSSSDSQVVYNNTSAFMFTPVDSATPSGYTFRGWSPSSDAEGALLEFTEDGKLELSGTTNDLYASYAYNVDVTFDANGGTGTAPSAMSGQAYMNYQGTKIGYQVTLPENTFTRDGYVFDGWYDAATDGTKVGDSAQSYKVLEAGTVLYAGWAEANYGITSDSSCGNYSEYSLTLKDAFDTASSGDIVCPLKAVTDASAPTLASGKTLTLDLNGYKITKTTSKITNKGTLTITGSDSNGSLSTSTMGTLVTNNGTLNLGTSSTSTFNIVNSDTTLNNGYTIVNNSSATLNVKGITNFAVYDRGIGNYGTLNISGGTLTLYYGSAGDGTNVLALYDGSTTTISGGTITGKANGVITTGLGASTTESGTLKITGGTITAQSSANVAVGIREGFTFEMSGGSIINEGTNSSLFVYSTSTAKITISGGTIKSSGGNALNVQGGSGSVYIGTDGGAKASPVIWNSGLLLLYMLVQNLLNIFMYMGELYTAEVLPLFLVK